MKKKIKSNPDKLSERLSKKHKEKHKDENTEKRYPNPDDSNEETGPPIKVMPITGGPHHPHSEEILDDIPK